MAYMPVLMIYCSCVQIADTEVYLYVLQTFCTSSLRDVNVTSYESQTLHSDNFSEHAKTHLFGH